MKLQHDKPLSSFAFNFNLRRYSVEGAWSEVQRLAMVAGGADIIAGAALHDPAWGVLHVRRTCEVRRHKYCSPRHRIPFDARNEGSLPYTC